jgi:hypothetical protein
MEFKTLSPILARLTICGLKGGGLCVASVSLAAQRLNLRLSSMVGGHGSALG